MLRWQLIGNHFALKCLLPLFGIKRGVLLVRRSELQFVLKEVRVFDERWESIVRVVHLSEVLNSILTLPLLLLCILICQVMLLNAIHVSRGAAALFQAGQLEPLIFLAN